MAKCNLGKVKVSSMPVSGRLLSRLRGDLCILCWGEPHGSHRICLLAGLRDRPFLPAVSNVFAVMSSYQTNNSRFADLFTDLSLAPVSASAEASYNSTVVSFTAPTSSTTASSLPAANVPDPTFLVNVVSAVKVALAAEKSSASLDVASMPVSMPEPASSSSWCVSGAFPLNRWALAQPLSFLRVLVFLRPNQPRLLQRPKVGIILLCLSLFLPLWPRALPIQAQSFLLVRRSWLRFLMMLVSHPLPACCLAPFLQQPFVVGPDFSPVPAKTVSEIVSVKLSI